MEYCAMALADENTYSAHGLASRFMNPRSSMARRLCSRKFSSIMKNDFTPNLRSISDMTPYNSSPVSQKFRNLPLPPKSAEVVQKLQPMGQPTDGMMVAATAPLAPGSFIPMVRASYPEMISGCRMGALSSSPR